MLVTAADLLYLLEKLRKVDLGPYVRVEPSGHSSGVILFHGIIFPFGRAIVRVSV